MTNHKSLTSWKRRREKQKWISFYKVRSLTCSSPKRTHVSTSDDRNVSVAARLAGRAITIHQVIRKCKLSPSPSPWLTLVPDDSPNGPRFGDPRWANKGPCPPFIARPSAWSISAYKCCLLFHRGVVSSRYLVECERQGKKKVGTCQSFRLLARRRNMLSNENLNRKKE